MSENIDKKIATQKKAIQDIKKGPVYQAAKRMQNIAQINNASALIDFVKCDMDFNYKTVKSNQQYFDDYYSSKMQNRRSSAVIKKAKEIRLKYQEKYPDINIVDLFSRFNGTVALSSVNYYDRNNNIILAIAIHILDALKATKKLEEALEYFPSYEEFKDFNDIYVLNDSVHHSFLLRGLVYLIANRNSNPRTGYYLFDPDDLQDKPVEYKTPKEIKTNRDRLNAILSLLSEHIIESAKSYYLDVFNTLTDVFLNAVSNISSGVDFAHFDKILKSASPNGTKNASTIDPFLSELDSATAIQYAQNLAKMYPAEAYASVFWNVASQTKMLMNVQFDNPFMLCFAYFLLLEQNDPVIWCNYSVIMLRNASAQLPWGFDFLETEVIDIDGLEDYFDDDDNSDKVIENRENLFESADEEIDTKENDDAQNETVDSENVAHYVSPLKSDPSHINNRCAFFAVEQEVAGFNPEKLKADTDDILHSLYTSSFGYKNPNSKESDDLNGVQFLLSRSGIIPPRNISFYGDKIDAIDKYDEKDLKQLLSLCFGALHSLGTVKKVALPITEAGKESEAEKRTESEKAEEEQEDDIPEIDIDSLLKEISSLKKQVKQLNKDAYDEKKKREDIEKELKQVNEDKDNAVSELAELRSMICPIDKSEKTVEFKVDFPYEPMLRHVVFGGATSWLKSMRYMLPSVRFIDPDTNPDLQLLRSADVVWFQSKVISHTFFGKVLDKCRQHNIDFQYLNFNSAEKCAEQLALYDMKKVEEETV